MVGRFESGALRREALAHESLTSRQGLAGACRYVAYFLIVVFLFYALFGSTSEDESDTRSPSPSRHYTPPRSSYGDTEFQTESYETNDEPEHLSFDFSLMAVLVTLFVFFLFPQLVRVAADYSTGRFSQPRIGAVNFAAGAPQPTQPGMLLGSPVIDVKPGELRGGGGGGGVFGSPGFGADWNGSAMPWTSPGTQGSAIGTMGLWGMPLPSAHAVGGLPTSTGTVGSLSLTSGLGAPSFGLGLMGASGQGAGVAHLPTEADCMETYANHGADLQQWVPRLRQYVDKAVIGPLISGLEVNDKMWQDALSKGGWKLTTEAPQQAYPGLTPQVPEVSVFDRFLPLAVLSLEPRASELWNQRQQWESFLIHPGFAPDQRAHVLGRLKEWRDRGIQNSMRHEWRTGQSPTDAHILENLLIKLLNMGMEFEKCFLATAHAPPLAKHLGQAPVVYLRQVTDQLASPKPAPHYEVVTMSKVWKFRPGNLNLLEALVLFIHALKRHQPRSYQSFPQTLRNAIESTMNLPGGGFPVSGFM